MDTLIQIDPKELRRSPFQLRAVKRYTRDYISLKASIKRGGILQPILIRGREIVDGAHRHQACLDLGLPLIPCYVRVMSDSEVLEAQVIANEQRIKTVDSDLAMRLWKITKTIPIEEVAYRMGKSTGWVRQVCNLEALTPQSLVLLDNGRLTFRCAYLLSRIPRVHQEDCWGLDEAELQHVIRELKATGVRPERPPVTAMYRSLKQVVEEEARPIVAGRIIINETDGSPVEVWKAALRWAMQLDKESQNKRLTKRNRDV